VFSVEAGLAQILSYMLGNPAPDQPCFGMIATGGSFIFLKLVSIHRSMQPLSYLAFVIQEFGHRLQHSQTFGSTREVTD